MRHTYRDCHSAGRLVLCLAACWIGLLGCSGGDGGSTANLPKTYPIKGKVYSEPGKTLAEAAIEFKLQGADEAKTSVATVTGMSLADGSIEVKTITSEGTAQGAPEGTYIVTVSPPNPSKNPQDQHLTPPTRMLPEPFTVKAGGDNVLNITVSELPLAENPEGQ